MQNSTIKQQHIQHIHQMETFPRPCAIWAVKGNSKTFTCCNICALSLDAPIADNIQQTFLDDLLTSYGTMETSFTKHLLQFYKGFEFRTLWNVDDTLAQFERTAAEAAAGTGSLQGVLQLTKALEEIESLESKGRKCFTKFRYSTNTHKWSFDNTKNAGVRMYIEAFIFTDVCANCLCVLLRT